MYKIRSFNKADFSTILSWCDAHNYCRPTEDLFSSTSYIVDYEGMPLACLSLYLTNCRGVCYVEGLMGNPLFSGKVRQHGVNMLFKHCEDEAKRLGYHRIMLISPNNKLMNRYTEIGYTTTLSNAYTQVKEL